MIRTLAAAVLLAGCSGCLVLPDPGQPPAPKSAIPEMVARSLELEMGCTGVDLGNGWGVTAKHCVDELEVGSVFKAIRGASRLEIKVTLVAISGDWDFALMRTGLQTGAQVLVAPTVGQHLYVVGYPVQLGSGQGKLTVTDGLFAGPINKDGELRITAPVYFGNSGGGVWSDSAELLGIAVNIYAMNPGAGFPIPYVGQAFMVPSSAFASFLN